MKLRTWKSPESYRHAELNELIERVKVCDADAIEEAVVFTAKESFGLWHGRARAKICRNLKSRTIPRGFQDLLVQAICNRLLAGDFSEQFKDQLAMAIRFRPLEMAQCAKQACESPKDYVQRYGQWVLKKLSRTQPLSQNAN
ncbi:MAG: hypothetical protein WKF77_24125 [Planctomycetaceae bacterium]